MKNDLDYNLLRVFKALMEERSVTAAAVRLGLTQSSMSNALNRLRSALDDRVLERHGNAMVPTVSALQLWSAISGPLDALEAELVGHDDFRPGRFAGTFAIAVEDYPLELCGPLIAAAISARAPRARLSILPHTRSADAEALFSGEADLVVGSSWDLPPGLRSQELMTEGFIGMVGAGHPLAGTSPTLDDYLRYPHVLVSGRGIVAGNVDAALAPLGRQRRVVLSLPTFAAAPSFVAGSDRILNIGRRLAATYERRFAVTTFALPVVVPGFDIAMTWHPRNTNGAMHRWVRETIAAALTGHADDEGWR